MEKNTHHSYISSNLKLALAKKFNLHISEITKEFLSTLTEIDLPGNNIKNIEGIEFAKNAKYINLTRNNIYDASYLSNLKNLTTLELNENKIEDISFLKNLKNLKSVGLESNNIKDIPNLKNNIKLDMINLDNNTILNLSNLTNDNFKNSTILASDQNILLEPIEIEFGKTVLFSSKVKWDDDTLVFLDNIQVNGDYDRVHTDEVPSILYSISEVFITNIKSDCVLKADFYHEDISNTPRILSGTLIQPIYLTKNSNVINKKYELNKKLETSQVQGCIKLENPKNSKKINNLYIFNNKIITLINDKGDTLYTTTNELGEYVFNDVPLGKYTLLFPVLSDYNYTSASVHSLNIKSKDKYIVNASTEFIN